MNGRYDPGKKKQKLQTTKNIGKVSKIYMLSYDLLAYGKACWNTHC